MSDGPPEEKLAELELALGTVHRELDGLWREVKAMDNSGQTRYNTLWSKIPFRKLLLLSFDASSIVADLFYNELMTITVYLIFCLDIFFQSCCKERPPMNN